MKISERWLREWTSPDADAAAIAAQLTMAGLEVNAVESLAPGFTDVVVAEILSVQQHPDADKLRVCQVNDGATTVQVVCGAPNARAGLKAPFARVGAVLPGDLNIKRAKLRGVESFGMLCGETEIGVGEDDSGLMELAADAPVGMALAEYLQLDDTVIELDLTPNRGDCFGMAGIAREVSVLNRSPLRSDEVAPVPAACGDSFPISIQAAAHCPRYVGRVIRNVDVSRPSPAWLQQRLSRAGLRSIDAVVDVTNYVLLEYGQPLHAFDLEQLHGGIQVRLANAGETIELLDSQQLTLNPDTLVIADDRGAVALAGIMGGKRSAVSAQTRHVFLESAFFAPELMAGKARSYGLHTDASHRFERGVDYTGQARAVERATELLLAITGGEPGPVVEMVETDHLPHRTPIELRRDRVRQMLGVALEDAEVADILQRLGMQVEPEDQGWTVFPPTWRFDIAIEVDLLEEIARIHGYNRLPSTSSVAPLALKALPESLLELDALRDHLVARGYREAITYSFIAPELQAAFAPGEPAVPVANPISSDMAVMRRSLLPGLVATVAANLNRQQQHLRLFEAGMRFLPASGGLVQDTVLAAVACGQRDPDHWTAAGTMDFFDIKGDLESLLAMGGRRPGVEFLPGTHPALHPGQSAAVWVDGRAVGWVGALHPALQRQLDLSQPLYLFEIEVAAISCKLVAKFTELSRFPAVRRDLAVVVDQGVAAADVLRCVRRAAGELLVDLSLFDTYQGKGIELHRKSLGLGLTFQHSSRTLTDGDVHHIVDQVVAALVGEFAASLRN